MFEDHPIFNEPSWNTYFQGNGSHYQCHITITCGIVNFQPIYKVAFHCICFGCRLSDRNFMIKVTGEMTRATLFSNKIWRGSSPAQQQRQYDCSYKSLQLATSSPYICWYTSGEFYNPASLPFYDHETRQECSIGCPDERPLRIDGWPKGATTNSICSVQISYCWCRFHFGNFVAVL